MIEGMFDALLAATEAAPSPVALGIAGGVIAAGVTALVVHKTDKTDATPVIERAHTMLAESRHDTPPAVPESSVPNSEEPQRGSARLARQEAMRSRRARATRMGEGSAIAQETINSSAQPMPPAASIFRARHISTEEWGQSGKIRIRRDEYWDSSDPVSGDRIQESMREANTYVDEAKDYVASIVVRGTAEDSMVQRRVTLPERRSDLGRTLPFVGDAAVQERIRARSVASAIASRIAYVDEEVYPERKTLDDVEHADEWERALAAMDDKLALHTTPSSPSSFLRIIEGGRDVDATDDAQDTSPLAGTPRTSQGRHFSEAQEA